MKRSLSSPVPRAEIIASFQYGTAAEPAPPAGTEASPVDEDGKPKDGTTDESSTTDSPTSKALAAVEEAIADLEAAVAAEPDAKTDPNDAKVAADVAQLKSIVETLKTDQSKDEEEDAPEAKAPADAGTPPPPGASASPPPTAPAKTGAPTDAFAPGGVTTPGDIVDDEGNVGDEVKCANPECGHPASLHADGEAGDNTGPCSAPGCSCEAFVVANQQTNPDDSDGNDDGSTGGGGGEPPAEDEGKLADPAAPDGAPAPSPSPGDAPPAPDGSAPAPASDPAKQNLPPETTSNAAMGPAFKIPVLVIMGQPTGDGRELAPDSLDWRVPPLPLMGLATSTHDPGDWDMNDPAVIVGRIDTLAIGPGEGSTQVVSAEGYFLNNEDGLYFADLVEQLGRLGISADIAINTEEASVSDVDENGFPTEMSQVLTSGTIMGATALPFAAFEGAYIVLAGNEDAAPIPQEAESGPTAVTAAAPIHFLTYEECEPCQSGTDLLVASAGPERPPLAWFSDPGFYEGDGRLVEILDKRGQATAEGKFACPITVTEEGEIYGHLAPWDICHVGQNGKCVTAPSSRVDYAHYKRGQYVVTAEGEKIRVGTITAGVGHASTSQGFSAGRAMDHYDNTALQCADVNVGEDEFGIWIHGAVRPDATESQIRMLRASSLSGDWRKIGGHLELVAALAVNQPGFPLAVVASGQIESLTAAGAQVMYRISHPAEAITASGEEDDAIPSWARRGLLRLAREDARERMASVRV